MTVSQTLDVAAFRRRLLAWFDRNARRLPWRGTRDPYEVWVSEIMLQQTQVATVVTYYQRFLDEFPTIAALAAAPEERVLRLWEGLGYYRRARQLHKAAQVVVAEHAGIFPRDIEAVRRLPGIGRYTAGAILSIAFDDQHPILEANTIRLFSRLVALRHDPTASASQKLLWEFAESLLPQKRSGTLNQALMELGSTVCTPREPACQQCPVVPHCPTYAAGLQQQIPVPKKRTQYEDLHEAAIVIWQGPHVFVRQCTSQERWAGLWDFARVPLQEKRNLPAEKEIIEKTRSLTGLAITLGKKLTTIKHSVTRYRITLDCYAATASSAKQSSAPPTENFRWLKPSELELVPLSVTARKVARLLTAKNGS